MSKKFWFVWNTRGRAPMHKHASLDLAQGEALRLYASKPDDTFVILESVREIASVISPVRITDLTSGSEEILTPEQYQSVASAIHAERELPF